MKNKYFHTYNGLASKECTQFTLESLRAENSRTKKKISQNVLYQSQQSVQRESDSEIFFVRGENEKQS